MLPSCFSASVDEHQGLVLRVKGGDLCPRYSAISAKALKKVDNRGPEQLALVPNAHGGFEASVPPLSAGEKGDVVVELDGRTSDGYPVHYSLPPLPLPATVKKSFAERLGRGLMVADGPVFFLLAMAFLALWRKKRAAPASPVTAQPPPPVVVAPVVEAPVVEAPVVEAPVAEATSPEESSSPKLVLLTTDDLDLIDPPGPSSSIADKLKAELASVRAELTKMMESSKQHAESLENVLLKQAEVATLVGGLGGPEGLPASVKPRAELVTAGMRAMDDLLIEGSDRGIALDSGLRALDARLAGIEGGVADPPQRRADIERINLVLVEKSEGQSAEELARLKARALVVKESVAAQAELSKAVEALTSERQALAAEKEAIANRLDQVTTEYNKLFAERAADARPSD